MVLEAPWQQRGLQAAGKLTGTLLTSGDEVPSLEVLREQVQREREAYILQRLVN